LATHQGFICRAAADGVDPGGFPAPAWSGTFGEAWFDEMLTKVLADMQF
jgi:hypothetical protein